MHGRFLPLCPAGCTGIPDHDERQNEIKDFASRENKEIPAHCRPLPNDAIAKPVDFPQLDLRAHSPARLSLILTHSIQLRGLAGIEAGGFLIERYDGERPQHYLDNTRFPDALALGHSAKHFVGQRWS